MARQARKKSKSGIYHIMLRGINKQDIFIEDDDYKRFLKTLYDCKKTYRFELYAYCLMGNHIHLLVKEIDEDISTIIKRIGCSFVYWYNKKYERVGHLFQDRFRSEPVEDDEYFLSVLRYIHQNPVTAGLVTKCEDYLYSSYKLYFIDGLLIDKQFTFELVSKEQFKSFHYTIEEIDCLDISESTLRLSDNNAKRYYLELMKEFSMDDFSLLTPNCQSDIVRSLKIKGASVPQITVLTGLKKWKVDNILYQDKMEG